MSKTIESYAQFHIEESARAAREVHKRMFREFPAITFFVYYKPMRIEAFREDEEVDRTVWTLAWPERVPTNLTLGQLIQYFASRTGSVPYLKGE